MITDTFENISEEIIKVNRNENAVKVDACILTFSHIILKYVLGNFECRKNARQRVAFRQKWSVRLLKQCADSEALRHTFLYKRRFA